MKEELVALEKELDKKFEALSIWEASFQNILSTLLLIIDNVDRSQGADTSMDYCSRLSYLFASIRKKGAKKAIVNSSQAIMELLESYDKDIIFLNAYAHFSMLMPQVHRGTIVVTKIEGNTIELDYASADIEYAELIDKIYALSALQVAFTYNKDKELYQFLYEKVSLGDTTFSEKDIKWVNDMSEFYKENILLIEVLPSAVLEQAIGLTYDEYKSITATIRAFAEYFICLGTVYLNQSSATTNLGLKNQLMQEYFENLVCCVDFNFVGFFMAISNLSKNKFLKGLSNYMAIYSNNTGENFTENAFCGDGFFPPICLMDKSIIFSPHACRYMLNVNNALYSLNKKNTKHFDNNISQYLEPTLINQLEYLFNSISGLRTVKNVPYAKSEIDLLVLSETEMACLVIQVKATIAPDSSRTVERVQGRALEGIEQIELFNKLSALEKLELINEAFNTKLTKVTTIDLLVLRSSAGSEKIWQYNGAFRIANYTLLASIISGMIEKKDYTIANFSDRVKATQDEIIALSKWEKEYQNLKIGDYTIKMPNFTIDVNKILPINFRSYNYLPDMEKSHS